MAEDLPSIVAFDNFCGSQLTAFQAACDKLGGSLAVSAKLVCECFTVEMRNYLLMAGTCKKVTDQAKLMETLQPCIAKKKQVGDAVKRDAFEKHCKALTEVANVLNWLCMPRPGDHVGSCMEAFDYIGNKIRVEYKPSSATPNPDQIAFCDSVRSLLKEFKEWVIDNHKLELTWNPQGVAYADYKPGATVFKAPAAAPAANPASSGGAAAPVGSTKDSLLKMAAELTALANNLPAATPATKPAAKVGKFAPKPKVPKCELQNKQWVVEHMKEYAKIEIENPNQTVYIFGCQDGAAIEILGKAKSITIDSCVRTRVHFDTTVASCELINCKKVDVACKGNCPSVSIDKTDGATIMLTKESLANILFSQSKSSEMNVQWEDDNGDLVEKPIPEQFTHKIVDGKITTDVSDLYSL